jgi:predicted metal-dependent peptidase
MNNQEDLSLISKDLMFKEPYYGFYIMSLNKIWDGRIVPTAGVCKNGINYQLAINPEFWESLSNNHKTGLLKHELLHIAFGHLTTFSFFSDKALANVAMDMEINQYIDKEYLPEGGINIDDYEDLNLDKKAGCRYYYDKLKKFQDKKNQEGTCGNTPMDNLLDNIASGNVPQHPTWEEFNDLTESEKKLIEKQANKVLQQIKDQTLKAKGNVPGEIEGVIVIEEVMPAKFDWRSYIRRFTGVSTKVYSKKIRRKENRRFEDNPGIKIKMKQHMLLGIDTSGSVSDNELKEFMNEIKHIHKAGVDITIIQCDTKINSIKSYNGKNELEINGRGGTEFNPVLEYFNANLKKYTSLVYFTDGEGYTTIKPKGNVLWVLSERSIMNTKLPGKVIKLEL